MIFFSRLVRKRRAYRYLQSRAVAKQCGVICDIYTLNTPAEDGAFIVPKWVRQMRLSRRIWELHSRCDPVRCALGRRVYQVGGVIKPERPRDPRQTVSPVDLTGRKIEPERPWPPPPEGGVN